VHRLRGTVQECVEEEGKNNARDEDKRDPRAKRDDYTEFTENGRRRVKEQRASLGAAEAAARRRGILEIDE